MAVIMVSALPEPEAKPDAKPGLIAPIAYSAPLVAASPFVRSYNGFAAPLIDARAPLAYSAYSPYVASPYAYSAYAAAPILV